MTDSLLSNWQSNYPWIRSQYAPSPYNRKSLVILHNRLILYLNQWYDRTDVLERKHTHPLHRQRTVDPLLQSNNSKDTYDPGDPGFLSI